MECGKTDCLHNNVCNEWKLLGNDNYINDSYGNCDFYESIDIRNFSYKTTEKDKNEAFRRCGYTNEEG